MVALAAFDLDWNRFVRLLRLGWLFVELGFALLYFMLMLIVKILLFSSCMLSYDYGGWYFMLVLRFDS